MKPPNIVTVHFLSAKWSKKLFTINHYELQNGKCIVTQELSAYEQTRRLYYRMLYINRRVNKAWVAQIASIPEEVEDSDKCLEKLKNRWIYLEGDDYYCSNNILESYAE